MKHFRSYIYLYSFFFLLNISLSTPDLQGANDEAPQIVALKKLTIGPFDNYQGSKSSSLPLLTFIQTQNMAPGLILQNTRDGQTYRPFDLSRDVKTPVWSPSGDRIAFISYAENARGDLCILKIQSSWQNKFPERPLNHKELIEYLDCYPSIETQESNPFWIDQNHIGIISKKLRDRQIKIEVLNLSNKKKEILVEGQFWAPSYNSKDRLIAVSGVNPDTLSINNNQIIYTFDLKSNPPRKNKIQFDLPGLSGLPQFSKDGEYLYFTHYLNDTNHDGVIDGNDNGVIFRIPTKQLTIFSGKNIFPEQLTSVEHNCSYPITGTNELYVTCSFEGTLDLYSLPLDGPIPRSWQIQQLWQAHQTARSYEMRNLILSTLLYRFPNIQQKEIYERLISNHLFTREFTSLDFFLKRYSQFMNHTTLEKDYILFLEIFTKVTNIYSISGQGNVSLQLKKVIDQSQNQVKKLRNHYSKNLLLLYFAFYQGNLKQSKSFWLKSHQSLSSINYPILQHLFLDITKKLFNHQFLSNQQVEGVYQDLLNSTLLTEESKLSYAFELLQFWENQHSNLKVRLNKINKMLNFFNKNSNFVELFKSENVVLKIAMSTDKKEKQTHYRVLDQLLSQHRDHYFLNKEMAIRSIQTFEKSGDILYLGYVATNWLRYTHRNHLEFTYALEQFLYNILEKGYAQLNLGEAKYAIGHFYGAVNMSNDLEAHYGHLISAYLQGEQEQAKQHYLNLSQNNLTTQTNPYILALQLLLQNQKDPLNPELKHERIEQALNLLKQMPENNPRFALKFLLEGFLYLKLANEQYSHSKDYADYGHKSHRSLMLAYDLARGNRRIQSSALINLGQLHLLLKNYALSAQYFQKRKTLGFSSPREQVTFSWVYAKVLYYNNQFDEALEEIKLAIHMLENPPHFSFPQKPGADILLHRQDFHGLNLLSFIEKAGFYALNSQNWTAAIAYYEKFISKFSPQSAEDKWVKSKVLLSLGTSYFKDKNMNKAEHSFLQAIKLNDELIKNPPVPRYKNTMVYLNFHPLRTPLLAKGFLGQLYLQLGELEKAKKFVNQRVELLNKIKNQNKLFPMKKEFLLSFILKEYQRLAIIYQKLNQLEKAQKIMDQSLEILQEYLKQTNNYLSSNVYYALKNYLLFGHVAPTHIDALRNEKLAQKVAKDILKQYQEIKQKDDFLQFREVQLQLFWFMYNNEALKAEDLLNSPLILERLEKSMPEEVENLKQFSPR